MSDAALTPRSRVPRLPLAARPPSGFGAARGLGEALRAALAWLEGAPADLARLHARDEIHKAPSRAAHNGRAVPCELVLAPDMAIGFTLELPRRADQHLGEIIAHQIPSQTPFSASDAVFGYVRTGRTSDGERLVVRCAAAPRAGVERQLLRAARAGYAPARLTVEGEPEGLDLLPADLRTAAKGTPVRRAMIRASGALAALCCALLLALGAAAILSTLELARLKASAGEVESVRGSLKKLTAEAAFLPQARAAAIDTLRILDAVASALPDDAYLEEISIEGKNVRLKGIATSAARALESIEGAPGLAGAAFNTAIVKDQSAARERFDITVKREGGAP